MRASPPATAAVRYLVVVIPPGSQAGLQLTTNLQSQEGGLVYDSSVPSSLGLDVTFDSYQYDSSVNGPADGIAFFLAASDPTNASASPITLGPFGGNLGYAADADTSTPGVTNGYLGFGLDVFGNFTNSDGKGSECNQTNSPAAESVVVRGPGNGTAGYCLLQSQQLDGSTLENPDPAPAPLAIAAKPHVDVVVSTLQAVPVEVAVNPTSTAKNDRSRRQRRRRELPAESHADRRH